MSEKNPYAEMTLEELKAVNWKELPLEDLWEFEVAVRDIAQNNLPAYSFWLEVLTRRGDLELERMKELCAA